MKTLRPYQEEALRVLRSDTSGLDSSGLGAGKTLVAVERCRYLKAKGVPRVLVVAPVNTLRQWAETFREQFPSLRENPEMLNIVGTPLSDPDSWKRILSHDPGVFCIGWDAMRGRISEETRREHSRKRTKKPNLTIAAIRKAMKEGTVPPWHKSGTWDLVIADEVHRANNPSSAQAKVLKLLKTRHKLALSNTPAGDKPEKLFSVLNWLWPKKYRAFWGENNSGWVYQWFHIEEKSIGGGNTTRKVGPEKRPGALWLDIPTVVRHQVDAQLTQVIERVVSAPMVGEQERIYREFEQQALAWLDDQPIGTPFSLPQRIRLRQTALGTPSAEVITRRALPYEEGDYVVILTSTPEGVVREAGQITKIARLYVTVSRENLDEKPLRFRISDQKNDKDPDRVWFRLPQQEREEKTTGSFTCGWTDTGEDVGLDIDFNPNAPQPKLDMIKEIVSDLPPSESVLVWTHSAKWARMAARTLNTKKCTTRAWTGDLSQKKRQELKESFGKDVRVLVAQIASLAEGVDGLQHICCCEIWASEAEYETGHNEQARGRLNRPGQKRPVQRWILQSEDSIDGDVHLDLLRKKATMHRTYRDNRKD